MLDLEAAFGEKFFFSLFKTNMSTEDSVVHLYLNCTFCISLNSPTAFCIIKTPVSDEAVWVDEAESASPSLFPGGISGVRGDKVGGISGISWSVPSLGQLPLQDSGCCLMLVSPHLPIL